MATKRDMLNEALRHCFDLFAEKVFYTLNPGTKFVSGWHIDLIAACLAPFDWCEVVPEIRTGA